MEKNTAGLKFKYNEKIVENLRKAFSGNAYVKIGIIGSGSTPGSIGYIAGVHEFGGNPRVTDKMRRFFRAAFGASIKQSTTHVHIPRRSFIRLTLMQKSTDYAAWIMSSRDKIFTEVAKGNIWTILTKVGMKWETYIHECFRTSGWGTWPKISSITEMGRLDDDAKGKGKVTRKPLRRTGALERAITHEVVL